MLAVLLVSFAALLLIRIPVAAAMGLSGALALFFSGMNIPLAVVPQRVFVMLDSSSLLAIPFFILAGAIMEQGGMARRMIAFAQSMVGHRRGGLAQVDVLASTIFSSLTGSSAASASATGSILIPAMKRAGYPAGYAAALEATSAAIGPIIPPSIIMVVYGSLAGVSVGQLFLSGIAPGLMITAGLFLVNAIMARRYGWGGEPKATISMRLKAAGEAAAALLTPLILIGGILGGIVTPTEAGAVAVIYSAMVSVFIYREIRLRDLFSITLNAAVTTGVIGLIIASAGIFGWVLALEQIPQTVVALVQGFTTDRWVAIILVIVVVLVIGCVVDVTAAVIILVPVFAPLGASYGFDPVHFGIIMCIALVYGNVTPPVGLLLFITAAIAKCSIGEIMRYQIPFYLVLTITLAATVALPGVVLFLARL